MSRGATAVKIRPGRGLEWDAEFLRDMRRLLGPNTKILVDGKYNYQLESAVELAKVVGEIGGHCFEEPISDVDLADVARLAGSSPVPLAYGEHAYGEVGFRELIELGGVRIVEPDVTVCGGISEARRISELAKRLDVELIPHVGGLTAIGFAANLHFAASLDVAPLFEYDAREDQPLRDRLVKGAPFAVDRIVKGVIAVPDGPGLGIEIDEDVLEQYPYVIDKKLASTFPTYGTPHL